MIIGVIQGEADDLEKHRHLQIVRPQTFSALLGCGSSPSQLLFHTLRPPRATLVCVLFHTCGRYNKESVSVGTLDQSRVHTAEYAVLYCFFLFYFF